MASRGDLVTRVKEQSSSHPRGPQTTSEPPGRQSWRRFSEIAMLIGEVSVPHGRELVERL